MSSASAAAAAAKPAISRPRLSAIIRAHGDRLPGVRKVCEDSLDAAAEALVKYPRVRLNGVDPAEDLVDLVERYSTAVDAVHDAAASLASRSENLLRDCGADDVSDPSAEESLYSESASSDSSDDSAEDVVGVQLSAGGSFADVAQLHRDFADEDEESDDIEVVPAPVRLHPAPGTVRMELFSPRGAYVNKTAGIYNQLLRLQRDCSFLPIVERLKTRECIRKLNQNFTNRCYAIRSRWFKELSFPAVLARVTALATSPTFATVFEF